MAFVHAGAPCEWIISLGSAATPFAPARSIDLRTINSVTKYPSIPTFHALGERGRLREEVQVSFGDDEIAHWRDGGGQTFLDERELADHATIADVALAPRLETTAPPTDLRATYAWLKKALPGETLAPLEGDRKGRPEGVVVRTRDRRAIAKLRFEDYERTLR